MNKVDNKPSSDDLVVLLSALSSTLEDIAASSVNGPNGETLYTNSPRNIIDRGASIKFLRDKNS